MAASPAFHFGAQASLLKYAASASASVVATLDSITGVNQVTWSVIGTDDTRTIASYTLTPSGSVGQTCTLTAGAAGTAGILQCTINGGNDSQTGLPSAATSTTAKWYVLTASGFEVGCLNEQMESSATTGWAGVVNALARAGGGAPSGAAGGHLDGTYPDPDLSEDIERPAVTGATNGAQFYFAGGAAVDGDGGGFYADGGAASGTGDGGDIGFTGGATVDGLGGAFSAVGGAATTGTGGAIDLISGGASSGGESGVVTIKSGDVAGGGGVVANVIVDAGAGSGGAVSNVVKVGTINATGVSIGKAAGTLQFHGFGSGVTKQTVTGSRGGNAALASLLTALANLGLIVDSSS